MAIALIFATLERRPVVREKVTEFQVLTHISKCDSSSILLLLEGLVWERVGPRESAKESTRSLRISVEGFGGHVQPAGRGGGGATEAGGLHSERTQDPLTAMFAQGLPGNKVGPDAKRLSRRGLPVFQTSRIGCWKWSDAWGIIADDHGEL